MQNTDSKQKVNTIDTRKGHGNRALRTLLTLAYLHSKSLKVST